MTFVNIKFESIKDISNFVDILSTNRVHAELSSRNMTVDARTLMGIIAMDISNPLTLMILEEENKAKATIQKIGRFIVA